MAHSLAFDRGDPVRKSWSGPGDRVRRGNVLLITLDQWRGDCLSASGHPVVRTPNLDRLAARGVRFGDHWANAAPCGPSRACLYTGTYLTTNGALLNGWPLDDRLTNIAHQAMLAGFVPTLFGYTDTGVASSPLDEPYVGRGQGVLPGFEVEAGHSTDDLAEWARWMAARGLDVPDQPFDLYRPDLSFPGAAQHPPGWAPNRIPADLTETAFLVERFLHWIDRRKEAWFAHLSLLGAHPPYSAPVGYHDRYAASEGPPFRRHSDPSSEAAVHPIAALGVTASGCPRDEAATRQLRATYWGKMAEVDHQIGRLLDHLEGGGHLADTLVVLTSDHGDQVGDHWMTGKLGWYAESYWVPLIFCDPRPDSDATRGDVINAVTESVDVLPTICEWMDLSVPPQCEGRSLLPHLRGAPPKAWRDDAHWQWDARSLCPGSAHLHSCSTESILDVVRTADVTYARLGDGSHVLMDRRNDPDELVNVASKPAARTILTEARDRLNARVGAAVDDAK